MTPSEVKIVNDLIYASVAQRDVVLWLVMALSQQSGIDARKLRADFLLGADRLDTKKGLDEAHQTAMHDVELALRAGALLRDPPLALE